MYAKVSQYCKIWSNQMDRVFNLSYSSNCFNSENRVEDERRDKEGSRVKTERRNWKSFKKPPIFSYCRYWYVMK
jgi:hypothetical protein